MRLFEETKTIFKNKIKLLEKEIEPYFNEENQKSYILVFLIYIEASSFLSAYLKENSNAYTLKENDTLVDENEVDNIEEYSIVYTMHSMSKQYLEVLSALLTTYDYGKYAKYAYSEYSIMDMETIKKERLKLIREI